MTPSYFRLDVDRRDGDWALYTDMTGSDPTKPECSDQWQFHRLWPTDNNSTAGNVMMYIRFSVQWDRMWALGRVVPGVWLPFVDFCSIFCLCISLECIRVFKWNKQQNCRYIIALLCCYSWRTGMSVFKTSMDIFKLAWALPVHTSNINIALTRTKPYLFAFAGFRTNNAHHSLPDGEVLRRSAAEPAEDGVKSSTVSTSMWSHSCTLSVMSNSSTSLFALSL